MYKDIELGFYLPSFFFSCINDSIPLKNSFLYTCQSTIIHEYVHFLQDLFTCCGHRRIILTVDILKTITRTIYYSKSMEFSIPYIVPVNESASTLIDFEGIFSGDSDLRFLFDRINKIEITNNNLVKGFEDEKVVNVFVSDLATSEIKSFQFGTNCILESMAYLIESCFNVAVSPPAFPYRIVELILRYEFPGQNISKMDTVFLCETSLCGHNPPLFLFHLIELLKNNQKSLNKENLQEILNGIEMEYKDGRKISLRDYFYMNEENAKQSLKGLFSNKNNYKLAHEWIEYTFNMVDHIKSLGFRFDMLVGEERIKHLNALMRSLGTSLMTNKDGKEYVAYHPVEKYIDQLPAFRAIFEIYNTLRYGKKRCDMKQYCKKHIVIDMTTRFCDNYPWKNVDHPSGLLCPYAQFWKMWGISNRTVTF